MKDACYWNAKRKAFVPYPQIIYDIVKAMVVAINSCLDGHVRPITWEEVQDGRLGYYAMAVAAYKVCNPKFKLEGELY